MQPKLYNNFDSNRQFSIPVDKQLRESESAVIASGYTSFDILNKYQQEFYRLSQLQGCRIIIGMAFHEGLSEKKFKLLKKIHERINNPSNQSGVFLTLRPFHGKVYIFENPNSELQLYLGSSNFSNTGLKGNLECTVPVLETGLRDQIFDFIDELESQSLLIQINQYKNSKISRKKLAKNHQDLFDNLSKHKLSFRDVSGATNFVIDLANVVSPKKYKSNLNTYFGKGRWSRTTNTIKPRPWYEIEIICGSEINSNPLYPKGDFLMYTDDGLIIPMRTQGDYYKNLRSKDSLQIFGRWLKGKLEDANVLNGIELITEDTLLEYGNSNLTLYKISADKYYAKF